MRRKNILLVAVVVLLLPRLAMASDGGSAVVATLALLGGLVLLSKIAAAGVQRIGQVAVLGEILLGLLMNVPALFGRPICEGLRHDPFAAGLAEFGAMLLLFHAGLESDIHELRKVGVRAFAVACVGVVAPFALGTFVVGPMLLPSASWQTHLFLGATLTATSVGITARVFKDLGMFDTESAGIVLGAAVIDDVLGLVILAVVGAVVSTGTVALLDVVWILLKAFGFLGGSIALGRLFAPTIGKVLSRIHTGVGMKLTFALGLCLGYAWLAAVVGLAPIVGAFAAGLLLDRVHFDGFHAGTHVEELFDQLGQWFTPVFFVLTIFTSVDLRVFADVGVLLVASGVVAAAIIGKLVSGFVAGKGVDWRVVGVGMIPRGEVGLIFLKVGKELGVVDDRLFAVVVVMIIVTTVITPLLLPVLVSRQRTHTSS